MIKAKAGLKWVCVIVLSAVIVSFFHSLQNRLLMEAIERGDVAGVRSLLNSGASPNVKGWPSKKTGLNLVLDRLDHQEYYTKRTALMLAAARDKPEVVRLLLNKGADIHPELEDGSTALSAAIHPGNIESVRILLDAGAAPNKQIASYALSDAAFAEDPDIILLLLRYGADINQLDVNGNTPLATALTAGVNINIVKLLLSNGARLDVKTEDGVTALMHATEGGNKEAVRLVLATHPDVNARDKRGETALMHAVRREDARLIKELIAHGADINAKDDSGRTTLMAAVENRDKVMIQELLVKNVDVNARYGCGFCL